MKQIAPQVDRMTNTTLPTNHLNQQHKLVVEHIIMKSINCNGEHKSTRSTSCYEEEKCIR